LFDILKTNLTESTESASHDGKRTPESSESGLSKGLMDKVSTFAASLHSKTLSGRLNIPRVSGENHPPVASPQDLMDKLNVFDDVLRRSTLCLKQVPGKISEIDEKL
jgi:hypothetical protein